MKFDQEMDQLYFMAAYRKMRRRIEERIPVVQREIKELKKKVLVLEMVESGNAGKLSAEQLSIVKEMTSE